MFVKINNMYNTYINLNQCKSIKLIEGYIKINNEGKPYYYWSFNIEYVITEMSDSFDTKEDAIKWFEENIKPHLETN